VQSTDFTPVPIGRRSLSKGHGRNGRAILCAFDLLEVNGEDVRQEPIEDRKRRLAGLLRPPHDGIALNEHVLPIGQEMRAGD
jgi:ATP-dependent DNA ligase